MNDKITILHVIRALSGKGGTPRKLLSLIKHSDHKKIQHVVLYFGHRPIDLVDDVVRSGGIVERSIRKRNYDIRLLFDIIRMVRKYRADIINTHFARSDIYGMVAGLLCRGPVIKSVHGILWNEDGNKFVIYLDRLLAPFRYQTVCNSYASLEAERKRSRVRKLMVIHNGVVPRECCYSREEGHLFRQKLGIPSDGFLVVNVGGIFEMRRKELIVDAVSTITEKGIDAYCVFAGSGRGKPLLEKHTKSLGIENRVRFFDFLKDVGALLASADAYVNMASAEGFGIAVVEAMFARVPVVLANAGSHPELIIHGESGLLVPDGSAGELADALTRLANDPSLRRRLGEGGAKRANEKFAISRFVSDFENLYEACVEETRATAEQPHQSLMNAE